MMNRAKRGRRGARDAGQAVVELIGYVFAVTVVAVICVQGIVVVQGVSATQQAARDGARACGQGEADWRSAAEKQLPGWASMQSATCTPALDGGVKATVTVQIPVKFGARTVAEVSVTRSAVMPRT